MLIYGLAFVLMGTLAEVLGGTNFRHFFDWHYPPSSVRWDDTRIKVLGGRIFFAVGVLLLALGAATQLG